MSFWVRSSSSSASRRWAPRWRPSWGACHRVGYQPTLGTARARKIERFLSQAFFVAEQFTGFPGNYTPLAETIRSFEELCDGKWDQLPDQAFMYVGAIEEAAAKAETLK